MRWITNTFKTLAGLAILVPICMIFSISTAGASGGGSGAAPPVTTTTLTPGLNCNYSIDSAQENFSIQCTGLGTTHHYLQGAAFVLCAGGTTSTSTCANLGMEMDSYDYDTNTPYALGGSSQTWFVDSSTAAKCPTTMSHQDCAASPPGGLIPSWTTGDPTTGCANGSSGTSTIGAYYYLWPPGLGGSGDMCAQPLTRGAYPDHTSSACFWYASTSTSSAYNDQNFNYPYDQCNANQTLNLSYSGTTTLSPTTPCTIETFTGPQSIDSPQDAIYNAVMSNNSHTLLAVPASAPNFATTPPSWVSYNDVLSNSVTGFAAPVHTDGTATLDVDMSTASTFSPIELYCSDNTGKWYDLGTISSIVASETPPTLPGSSTDCYSTLSFGWNPGTDVISGFKALGCVAQSLFVPDSAHVTALTNQFGFTSAGGTSGCTATAPGLSTSGSASQWLGAGFTLITNGPSCAFNTIQSEANAGETDTVLAYEDTFSSHGHTYHVGLPEIMTAATSNADVAGVVSFVLALDTAMLAVAFFFMIREILQWAVNATS